MKRKHCRENLNKLNFDDMDVEMMRSYDSILFLGTSMFDDLEKFKSDFLGAYHLCLQYFMERNDYPKVNEIIKLLCMMDGQKKVIIDKQLIDSIHVSLN